MKYVVLLMLVVSAIGLRVPEEVLSKLREEQWKEDLQKPMPYSERKEMKEILKEIVKKEVERKIPEFERRKFGCLSGKKSLGYTETRGKSTEHRITFDRPFRHTPAVVFGLSKLESNKDKNVRIRSYITEVTRNEFTLKLESWDRTLTYDATVNWMACPKKIEHVEEDIFTERVISLLQRKEDLSEYPKYFERKEYLSEYPKYYMERKYDRLTPMMTRTEIKELKKIVKEIVRTEVERKIPEFERIERRNNGCLSGKKTLGFSELRGKSTEHRIKFKHPFRNNPAIVFGLSHLNSDKNENVRIRSYVTNVRKDEFILKVESMRSSLTYEATVHWMACPKRVKEDILPEPEMPNIERKYDLLKPMMSYMERKELAEMIKKTVRIELEKREVRCLSGKKTLELSEMRKSTEHRINFKRPFKYTPTVVFGLSKLECNKNRDIRIKSHVTEVTRDGFNLKLETWGRTLTYDTTINWMACPKKM